MVTRRVAVLTTGRQDWGILRSTCRWLDAAPDFETYLVAAGMACSPEHGELDRQIASEGFRVAERLVWPTSGAEGAAHLQAAAALAGVGAALERARPEMLVLVGDRFETLAAGLAATVARVPIVHLHGGETTSGAFDDALRHALSKLALLHLVSHTDHARRLVEMGEDPAAIHVVGAPGLDNLNRDDLPDRAALEAELGMTLDKPVVAVTVHPTTWAADPCADAVAVAAALDLVPARYVITLPNADPGAEGVRAALAAASQRPGRIAASALGERRYWGLLRLADAMVGNSSSALVEAPAVNLPAVDVGERQRGRLRGANVIAAPADAEAIARALRKALDPAFRKGLAAAEPLFGDGRSAERIGAILRAWKPPSPPVKRAP